MTPHTLTLSDGRTVPLRFTWRAIDGLGRQGVLDRVAAAAAGEQGSLFGLAEVIEAGTAGAVTADELMDGAAPPYMVAQRAVWQAWSEQQARRRPWWRFWR